MMRPDGRTTLSLFLLLAVCVAASAQDRAEGVAGGQAAAGAAALMRSPPINVYGREQVSLDGRWRYIIDPLERPLKRSSTRWNFFRNQPQTTDGQLVEYDWATSPEITVPSDWNRHSEELKWYTGLLWYYREFDAPAQAEGKRVVLNFEAANYRAHVFLNGERVGEHEGGFTPFAFDVTDKLRGKNFLVVGVNSRHGPTTVPGPDFDWWNYGGLTRPVSLVLLPETYIHDYLISYELRSGKPVIRGFAQITGSRRANAQVEISIPELGLKTTARADAGGRAGFEFEPPAALRLWSPEEPKLYQVVFKSPSDEVKEEVGFRTIEVRGTEIVLNGRPVYLRGVCLHEEAVGAPTRTLDWRSAKQLLDYAKELNSNFVRLAHYPHTEKMTRLADRMGLLVWSEVPVYQGYKGDVDFADPRTLAVARQMLTENYERDKNRASIIIWSIANETPISPERNAFLEALARHTRALDPTRLVSAAINTLTEEGDRITLDDPLNAHLDLLAVNTYVGWYGDGLPDVIAKKKWVSPYAKPLIFSEFGADAPHGNRGSPTERWTEEYQQFMFAETLKKAREIPFLRGTAPWILKDFRSPRRWHGRHQNYWNRKGVIGERGERKLAFKTLQDWYAAIAREAATASAPRAEK
jgi:beta-glucuronidase